MSEAPTGRPGASDPLAWLREAGAGRVRHSRRTLLDHLCGTRDLLAAWGARPAVCDAGLFHSVYGTSRFPRALVPPTQREVVRELIGAEAERRVWLFHTVGRSELHRLIALERPVAVSARLGGASLELAKGELEDLANLVVANAVEQAPFRGRSHRRRTLALLESRIPIARPKKPFDEQHRRVSCFSSVGTPEVSDLPLLVRKDRSSLDGEPRQRRWRTEARARRAESAISRAIILLNW